MEERIVSMVYVSQNFDNSEPVQPGDRAVPIKDRPKWYEILDKDTSKWKCNLHEKLVKIITQ